jgi:glyoxylase I family protein
MKLEHLGLNVSDPRAATLWYQKHLGLQVVRRMETAPFTTFLADSSGTMMLEIYHNPPDQVPPYANMSPLLLHVAFVSNDPEADKKALLSAGATFVEEARLADGSLIVTMRDPWGLAIQFCRRTTPMLRSQEKNR